MKIIERSVICSVGLKLSYLNVAQVNLASVVLVPHSDIEVLLGHGVDHFRIQNLILSNIGRHSLALHSDLYFHYIIYKEGHGGFNFTFLGRISFVAGKFKQIKTEVSFNINRVPIGEWIVFAYTFLVVKTKVYSQAIFIVSDSNHIKLQRKVLGNPNKIFDFICVFVIKLKPLSIETVYLCDCTGTIAGPSRCH